MKRDFTFNMYMKAFTKRNSSKDHMRVVKLLVMIIKEKTVANAVALKSEDSWRI